jgi:hypothetical protein
MTLKSRKQLLQDRLSYIAWSSSRIDVYTRHELHLLTSEARTKLTHGEVNEARKLVDQASRLLVEARHAS